MAAGSRQLGLAGSVRVGGGEFLHLAVSYLALFPYPPLFLYIPLAGI